MTDQHQPDRLDTPGDDTAAAPAGLSSPWPDVRPSTDARGGAAYAALHAAQRLLQDRLAGASLPPEVSRDVTARLQSVLELLAPHQGPESDRHDGYRPDLPGRGHPFLPPYVVTDEGDGWLRGIVTLGRFHLGGNAAAHGGAHPLLFDDILGRVVNSNRPTTARTAFLTTNYRAVTPLDVELTFEARQDRVDGRKRFASARLSGPTGELLSDCTALFVELLPGRP